MDFKDEELIEKLIEEDEELKTLVTEHKEFESQLEDFNRRPYLTTEEQFEKKRLQKQKLAGKDRIEAILAEYRKQES